MGSASPARAPTAAAGVGPICSATASEQTGRALRESEERLQRALEATGLCLWDFDVPSGAIYLSEGWSQQLGGPFEVTRTTFAELAGLVPLSDCDALYAALMATLKDPERHYRVEHRVRKRDGEYLWNLSEGRVVERAADGHVLRMVGTNRDITQKVLADDARHELEAQLRESQKMEAIGTLAAGIAHDFNNILGALLGNVAMARDDVGEGHVALQSLEQIHKSALRARSLVRQILAFGRHQPQERVNRALLPLVREALAMLRASLPATVAIEGALADEPLHVLADATQMQQVLVNLCTNAWHALPNATGRIVVTLDAVEIADGCTAPDKPASLPSGRYARLSVRDDGCGMDASIRSRIFEPFFTTKPVGRGTGLGLSVVHGIVLAHGGAITVESECGRGSTFRVYLPLVDPQVTAALSGWGSLSALRSRGSGEHVLYVDDDEVIALVAERLLRRLGYRVTSLQDPVAAAAAVRADPLGFDLVVADFNMPVLSGLELARELARIRPDLPVAVSSGYLTDEQRVALLQAGVREIVQKEATVELLGDVVERLVRSAL